MMFNMNTYKTVDEFLAGLDPERRALVRTLRDYVLHADTRVGEHIKWNAPSYTLDGEDRITFNTINKENAVKLVFHMGARRKEDKSAKPLMNNARVIRWVSDIRGYASFQTLEEVVANEGALEHDIKHWLTHC